MENDEVGPSNGKSNDQFIDRSKVRILLCDNDSKSSQEVFSLLCKCSYQGNFFNFGLIDCFYYYLYCLIYARYYYIIPVVEIVVI